jgi:hypothetical protein
MFLVCVRARERLPKVVINQKWLRQQALDMLDKLLQFDPSRRLTAEQVSLSLSLSLSHARTHTQFWHTYTIRTRLTHTHDQALAHPYMAELHDIDDEPAAPELFDFGSELLDPPPQRDFRPPRARIPLPQSMRTN